MQTTQDPAQRMTAALTTPVTPAAAATTTAAAVATAASAPARAAAALRAALASSDGSVRLQAAMTAGTHPHPHYVDALVARCAVEPDFQVREMLTWALIQLPVDTVLPRVLAELTSASTQAQSQALHTVSKLRDARAWPAITPGHLHHTDDTVARTAWRAAVAVAPAEAHTGLAQDLTTELGRGDTDTMRSLSRALVGLGDGATAALSAATAAAATRGDAAALSHARATERLLADPEAAFALDPADAARLGRAFSARSGGDGAH